VLGGGAARAGELLLEPARRVALSHVVPGSAATQRSALHGITAPGYLAPRCLLCTNWSHPSRRRPTRSPSSFSFRNRWGPSCDDHTCATRRDEVEHRRSTHRQH
jgi:hypothetical protein